ncbi:MAG TPA: multicopper oxidase domain-containing protein [Verrucomicrobiae bacterium]|nr:multicopper oxidase domain-containing protein [Verrucomicrobiae bacterium]
MAVNLPLVKRPPLMEKDKPAFHKHVCPPSFGGDNPDPLFPDVVIKRNLLVGIDHDVLGPTGETLMTVPMWIIEDPDAPDAERRTFPSRIIRIPQDSLTHARVGCQGNTHTIHWHGIEPTPMNDGVGKHSFEVAGPFVYQFQPRQAGTFFYHCHKNTTLHFEMGLYGFLIVDPPPHPDSGLTAPYVTGGPGFAEVFNPNPDPLLNNFIKYDVEALWAADDMDSRWHELGHNAFMQKCDKDDPINPANFETGFLHDFRQDVFSLSGISRVKGDERPITVNEIPPASAPPGTVALAAPTVGVGQTLYVRFLAAGYSIQRLTITGLNAMIVAGDGHPFGVPPFGTYSKPVFLPAGTPLDLTTARRNDLVIKPTVPGVYPVTIQFFHTVSLALLQTMTTFITVV